jgi:type I restriction enzyme S subunit
VSARELITEYLDLWTGAVTKKSNSGRGSNGKVELTGVKKLRELILGMAVQGKLTTREASDEPASELLQRISARQTELYTQGKIKKRKKLLSVSVEEQYFHLPENWEWTRLGALFDSIISGGTPSKQNPRFWDGDIPWASVKDLGKTKHLDETQDYITEEGLKAGSKLADTGDVLICTRMGLGKVAICSKPIAINQDLKAVKVSPEVSLDYFFLAYTTLDITGTGTTVAGITQDKLISYVIGLPPIEEQHRIVQKVDELMALCDRLEQQTSDQLEAHETLVDTLLGTLTQSENATELADNWARLAEHFDTLFTTEQSIDKLKQTILQLAVMGRLVEQDAGDEPAYKLLNRIAEEKIRLLAARKLKRQKPLTEIGEEEKPFELPSGWHWARFGDVCEIKGELVRPESFPDLRQVAPDCIEKGTGRITENRTVKESGVKGPNSRFFAGQIVYSKIRPSLSKAALVDFDGLCSADMYPIDAFIDSRFLLMEILSEIFLQQVRVAENRVKMPKLNQESLTGFVIPIPPLAEQHRIVQKVHELMALCDHLKQRLNQASETRCQLAEAVADNALN